MPDINIDFYPGTACENLGSPDGCVDGWHLYSIPLLADSYNPYELEEIFGPCNTDPENNHMDGFQIVTEAMVALCHTGMGFWIGSLQQFESSRGHFTRNQFEYPFSIELESELPPLNELPVDESGNIYWRSLHLGMNLI